MFGSMSPELQLATACCHFPRGPAAQEAIAAALAKPIDWSAFEEIVRRHRIPGLAAAALCSNDNDVPADARQRLAKAGRECATQDLIHAAETARLQRLFDQADIPAMLLKGVPVGILAYGRIGVKQSWDIDLLTTEAYLMPAFDLLERHGYRLAEPADLSRQALSRFARFTHEVQLRDDRGIAIELHWRLFSKPVLPGIDGTSDTVTVEVAGYPVKTLREDLLIAYLIAHGQEHGWGRLKWLADLGALLAQKNEAELGALYAQALTDGRSTEMAAAYLLCARLLGLNLPVALAATIENNEAAVRLAGISMDCIAHPLSGIELPVLSRASLNLIASRFFPVRGWRLFFAELAAIWTQPAVRVRYPANADFLYHLLRVPIWLLRMPMRLGALRQTAPARESGSER